MKASFFLSLINSGLSLPHLAKIEKQQSKEPTFDKIRHNCTHLHSNGEIPMKDTLPNRGGPPGKRTDNNLKIWNTVKVYCSCFYFVIWDRVSCRPGQPLTLDFLPPPPKSWAYRHVAACPTSKDISKVAVHLEMGLPTWHSVWCPLSTAYQLSILFSSCDHTAATYKFRFFGAGGVCPKPQYLGGRGRSIIWIWD